MNADGQPTAFSPCPAFETGGDGIDLFQDMARGIEEFLAIRCRPRSAVGALEQSDAQPALKGTQPPAECRLANPQGLSGLTKTAMRGRDDGPFQVSEIEHAFHHQWGSAILKKPERRPRPSFCTTSDGGSVRGRPRVTPRVQAPP